MSFIKERRLDIKNKIVILGATGMLGSALSSYFSKIQYEVLPITRNEFDVIKDPVQKLIPFLSEDVYVINCIGIIRQIISAFDVTDVLKINSIFPINLSLLCNELKANLIQVSTDCVFSGKTGNYKENDLIDGEDIYAVSKICGEPRDCMILRTSIIGFENKSFVSLLEWSLSEKGRTISGYRNHLWNGTATIEFAKAIDMIISNKLYKTGVFHLFSPDSLSKFELLYLLNEIFELRQTITPIDTPSKCDRTLSSNYSLSSEIIKLNIRQQIYELKEFYGR